MPGAPWSYQHSNGGYLSNLPAPDSDNTLDWSKVQLAHNGDPKKPLQALSAKAGSQLPAIIQGISYSNEGGQQINNVFSVESSPKWFSHVKTEFDSQGNIAITLAVSPQKTGLGRVVKILTTATAGNPDAPPTSSAGPSGKPSVAKPPAPSVPSVPPAMGGSGNPAAALLPAMLYTEYYFTIT